MNRREFMGKVIEGAAVVLGTSMTPLLNEKEAQEQIRKDQELLEEAREFFRAASYDISPEMLADLLHIPCCCIDGRRPKGEKGNPPPLATPGADAGIVETMLAAAERNNLPTATKRQIIDRFAELRGGKNKLHFHTDEAHKDNNDGCGHLSLSKENHEKYGLSEEAVRLTQDFMKEIQNRNGIREVLEGKHQEKMIIIVDDPTIALRHGQAFIYNKALIEKLLEALAQEMAPMFKIDAQNLTRLFKEINEKQLMETVAELGQGKPVFVVKNRDTIERFNELPTVPVKNTPKAKDH